MSVLRWFRRGRAMATPEGPEGFRRAYESFRRLVDRNGALLGLMAELETSLPCEGAREPATRARIERVVAETLALVEDLASITGRPEGDLTRAHGRLAGAIGAELSAAAAAASPRIVVPLADPAARDRARVGGKAANLAEVAAAWPDAVPPGFVVTTDAFCRVCAAAGLRALLRRLADEGSAALAEGAAELRRRVTGTPVPGPIVAALAQAAAATAGEGSWAVRSSGAGEGGPRSFAGQYDTRLGVPTDALAEAYRAVVASRFSDRALAYEGAGWLTADAPLAVLCLRMVDARAAGVLYTRDPHDPAAPTMWIGATLGLGADLVGGRAQGDLFVVRRDPPGELVERRLASKDAALRVDPGAAGLLAAPVPEEARRAPSIDDASLRRLAELGLAIEARFGAPQDIEWAQDRDGRPWILQARPLVLGERAAAGPAPPVDRPVRLRGRSLSPGRAAGPVRIAATLAEIERAPAGAVLVVRQATPELARVLDRIAGVVAEAGGPQSHAAALLRQAGVPAVSEASGALAALRDGELVGIDGGVAEVYEGVPWPEVLERPRPPAPAPAARGFVHELVLRLTLVDPAASSFRADRCASLHDVVRLVHERALGAVFQLGDRFARGRARVSHRLVSRVPLDLDVLDLGGGLVPGVGDVRQVAPAEIASAPFRALWRGVEDPRVSWSGRQAASAGGFFSVVGNTLMREVAPMRRLGDRNFLVVATDYLNLNARLAYHYAMLDAVVGDRPDGNALSFRFFGGGAARARRDLRARFLAAVLERLGLGVDRRGDLVNAWLRAAPRASSEAALEALGRLMACTRQLDMLLGDERELDGWVQSFLDGDLARFA